VHPRHRRSTRSEHFVHSSVSHHLYNMTSLNSRTRVIDRWFVPTWVVSFYFEERKRGGGRKDVTLIQLEDYLEPALSQHFLRVLRRERTFEFWNDCVGIHSRRRATRLCFLSRKRQREREPWGLHRVANRTTIID